MFLALLPLQDAGPSLGCCVRHAYAESDCLSAETGQFVAWLHGFGAARKAIGSTADGKTLACRLVRLNCSSRADVKDPLQRMSERAQINTILSSSKVLNIASLLPFRTPSTKSSRAVS